MGSRHKHYKRQCIHGVLLKRCNCITAYQRKVEIVPCSETPECEESNHDNDNA